MTDAHTDFEPRITAFVCNWCTYTGADLAGTSRLHMASNVRIIRLPCTGRIDPLFITKAFERGADGVIVSGCHPADCHYTSGNYHARRRFAVFHDLLRFIGVDEGRITFSWVSASEGAKWRDVVDEAVAKVRALGPFTAYRELIDLTVSGDRAVADGAAAGSEAGETAAVAAAPSSGDRQPSTVAAGSAASSAASSAPPDPAASGDGSS
jgi:F420-non-reducing hydrogenase iron-sulfur subunit